jgi:hypothetical protein
MLADLAVALADAAAGCSLRTRKLPLVLDVVQ